MIVWFEWYYFHFQSSYVVFLKFQIPDLHILPGSKKSTKSSQRSETENSKFPRGRAWKLLENSPMYRYSTRIIYLSLQVTISLNYFRMLRNGQDQFDFGEEKKRRLTHFTEQYGIPHGGVKELISINFYYFNYYSSCFLHLLLRDIAEPEPEVY